MSLAAPGRVNAHTHMYSGLVPLGLPALDPPPESFPEILERLWWRLDRALDGESLRASARLYVSEALLEGTTALIDHHESPSAIEGSLDILADACDELGMRAVLCYGATERNGGRAEARRGLAECERFITTNTRKCVSGVVGLHASFTVSDETVEEAGALARKLGTVVHVHVAEDVCDVRDAIDRGFASPLDRLIELNGLPPGSILAHGVHLTAKQVEQCEELGLWLVQNPRSNRANSVGYPRSLGASWRVALGTDGFPSDMVDEAETLVLDACAQGENLDAAARRLAAGHVLLAELFGVPEGAMLDGDYSAEVSLGRVKIGGRTVVRDGQLVSGDLAQIRAEAEEQAHRLWARMARLG